MTSLKFTLILTATLEKLAINATSDMITTKVYFWSDAGPILHDGNIWETLEMAEARIIEQLEVFANEGDGWVLK